jgi:hypothetical protein
MISRRAPKAYWQALTDIFKSGANSASCTQKSNSASYATRRELKAISKDSRRYSGPVAVASDL